MRSAHMRFMIRPCSISCQTGKCVFLYRVVFNALHALVSMSMPSLVLMLVTSRLCDHHDHSDHIHRDNSKSKWKEARQRRRKHSRRWTRRTVCSRIFVEDIWELGGCISIFSVANVANSACLSQIRCGTPAWHSERSIQFHTADGTTEKYGDKD